MREENGWLVYYIRPEKMLDYLESVLFLDKKVGSANSRYLLVSVE
jgi:hypothetical protein